MALMLFDQPIYVKRTNHIEEITCVEDALDLLEEWPLGERNLVSGIGSSGGGQTQAGPILAGPRSKWTLKRLGASTPENLVGRHVASIGP